MTPTISKINFERGSVRLQILTGGSGSPLLVLHDEMGYPGCMPWQSELMTERQLLIPLAPGFGIAPRIEWVASVRDLACVYARWLREQTLTPIDVIGFSLGGWLAAEILANDPNLFRRVVLVAPLGIKPDAGVICDAFELTHRDHLKATIADAARTPEFDLLYGGAPSPSQIEAFEDARAESARLGWQPYMHNPSLPHLLEELGTKVPVHILWGEQDKIVPRSAMLAFKRALGVAALTLLPGCGHRPEIEQREQFLALVRGSLGNGR